MGHPGGCGNMVYRNTFHIIWYNITIWYGNIAILYGTQLTLNYNTLTILSACGGFFSSRKSVACGALQPFLTKRPLPPPQKKCPRGAAPIGLYNLNKDYVKVLHKRFCLSIGTIVTGFTKATITSTLGECTQFYAHPCFQGHPWYDWALVHFQEVNNKGEEIENHYPSKILGFLDIEGKCEAVIQCSVKPLRWSVVERFFFVKLQLGTDFNISFVTVPIETLVHPLCVIPDSGGDRDICFVVLPKRNWSQFFGERIIITKNIYLLCMCVREQKYEGTSTMYNC